MFVFQDPLDDGGSSHHLTVRVMHSDKMGKHVKIGQVVLDKAKVADWLKGGLGSAEEVTEFLVDTKGERVKVCVCVTVCLCCFVLFESEGR